MLTFGYKPVSDKNGSKWGSGKNYPKFSWGMWFCIWTWSNWGMKSSSCSQGWILRFPEMEQAVLVMGISSFFYYTSLNCLQHSSGMLSIHDSWKKKMKLHEKKETYSITSNWINHASKDTCWRFFNQSKPVSSASLHLISLSKGNCD